ncbi:MAG: DUF502 domain-containing protein [Gammaproteobacteria bacterium]|nr:DUF502 domain-containing protein [Gammaproteobacteria bacterium]
MKTLSHILVKGSLTIMPVSLTLYFFYWLGRTAESLLSGTLNFWLPRGVYQPGMGLIAGFLILFVVGLLVNAFVVQRVLAFGESLLLRIPVIKTVYAAFRDITGLMGTTDDTELQRAVLVRLGPGRMLGFVTRENAALPGVELSKDLVAVYMPMAYTIGGYTIYVTRDFIEPTDLSVEAAMRIAMTGGLRNK